MVPDFAAVIGSTAVAGNSVFTNVVVEGLVSESICTPININLKMRAYSQWRINEVKIACASFGEGGFVVTINGADIVAGPIHGDITLRS
jgi:hypothetical protein